jgi:hypothetical protein
LSFTQNHAAGMRLAAIIAAGAKPGRAKEELF